MTRFLLLQPPPVVETHEMVQIRNFCITDTEGCTIPGTYLQTPGYAEARHLVLTRGISSIASKLELGSLLRATGLL